MRNDLYVDHVNLIFRKLHLIWSEITTLRFVRTCKFVHDLYFHFPSLSSQFLSFTLVKTVLLNKMYKLMSDKRPVENKVQWLLRRQIYLAHALQWFSS